MTSIAICSAKGSPGVTTLTCALAAVWPTGRRVIVAECDPSGSDLTVRFGLSPRLGMTSLVVSHRHTSHDGAGLEEHLQRLPGGLEVLGGPVGSDSALLLDREVPEILSHTLKDDATDVLLDCGQFLPTAHGQRELMNLSSVVVVVSRSDAGGLAHTRWLLERLEHTPSPVLVLVGKRVFSAREIEALLGSEVLEIVPSDERAAAMVCGGPGRPQVLARSPLIGSAKRIVQRLAVDVDSHCTEQLVSGDHPDDGDDQSIDVLREELPIGRISPNGRRTIAGML